MVKSTKKKNTKPILFSRSMGLKNIVVVDESYTHAGLSVWNVEETTLLNFQQFKYPKNASHKEKRLLQASAVNGLVALFDCNAVIVEEPRMFPSAQTKARLHEMIASIADRIAAPVYMANTTSWKAGSVGHNASKEDTVKYVELTYSAIVDDDVADAICIGEAVCRGMKLTKFD